MVILPEMKTNFAGDGAKERIALRRWLSINPERSNVHAT